MPNYSLLQQTFTVNTYVQRGLTIVKGEDCMLYDESGKAYLDVMSNYGVTICGHSNPAVTKALTEQLEKVVTLHASFANDTRALASKELIKRVGLGLKQVYYSSSGAEAIEAALKFAVLATGKKRFITMDHGYHGKTLGALSATAGKKYKELFEPLLWDFATVKYNDIEAIKSAITADTAGIILEPVQGEGGIIEANPEYLKAVRALCDEHGILLIVDEIQTGCGRTGTFLAIEKSGIQPDIVTLGKGLAGGIPVGATLVNKQVADAIPKHIHTSTFGGNPLACAGILATLAFVTEERLSQVTEIGEYFMDQLRKLDSKSIVDVRGKGLMLGVEVTSTELRNDILKRLQQNGILAIPAGDAVVRFLPPFTLQKSHVDTVIKALQEILS